MFRWLFRKRPARVGTSGNSRDDGEKEIAPSLEQIDGSESSTQCPSCDVSVSMTIDRIGVTGEAASRTAFGVEQVRLRCPRCRTVFGVGSRNG